MTVTPAPDQPVPPAITDPPGPDVEPTPAIPERDPTRTPIVPERDPTPDTEPAPE